MLCERSFKARQRGGGEAFGFRRRRHDRDGQCTVFRGQRDFRTVKHGRLQLSRMASVRADAAEAAATSGATGTAGSATGGVTATGTAWMRAADSPGASSLSSLSKTRGHVAGASATTEGAATVDVSTVTGRSIPAGCLMTGSAATGDSAATGRSTATGVSTTTGSSAPTEGTATVAVSSTAGRAMSIGRSMATGFSPSTSENCVTGSAAGTTLGAAVGTGTEPRQLQVFQQQLDARRQRALRRQVFG